MEFLFYYTIFAITTAIVSVFELLHPIIQKREKLHEKIENKTATYVAFIGISLLIAPLIFFSCIVPVMGEVFRKSLYDGVFPKP